MEERKLTTEEVRKCKEQLLALSRECPDREMGREDPDSEIFRTYSLERTRGRQICAAFTDEQLLAVLVRTARELNHSPAQREVFWPLREYLRSRFGKWPYALSAAGLSKSAGGRGKSPEQEAAERQELQTLLAAVREKARELGRLPHPTDLPETAEAVSRYLRTWHEVLTAADIDPRCFFKSSVYRIDDLEPEVRDALHRLREQAERLGRSPLRCEVDPELKARLVARCGSWRNALFQIGLEPVIHIAPFSTTFTAGEQKPRRHSTTLSDCYYRLLRPDAQTRADLAQVQALSGRLGRPPRRTEVPDELRQRLQKSCGSWENALFQLGLIIRE